MKRRDFLALVPTLAAVRSALAASPGAMARIGLCTFSCHQHWKAVQSREARVKFDNPSEFYRYAVGLGAEGVQTSLRGSDPDIARAVRESAERVSGFFEAELTLPKAEQELPAFEHAVRLARDAGATVARTVASGGRRYESYRTPEEFRSFRSRAIRMLELVEPVLRRHRLRMAVENHKDFTTPELLSLIRGVASEWIGILVDTGNNIALLEDPHETVEALAPLAFSVHLKDMAVQPSADGFLLSEVPLGTGVLDLKRVIAALVAANPSIVLNLEMATRDPLRVPCRNDAFFATFPDRKAERLESMLRWVSNHPPTRPPPSLSGKDVRQILDEEESNNRQGLGWMRAHLRTA